MSRLDLYRIPPRRPLVAASILSADFAQLAAASRGALEAGADSLHLDVMDGHFVPNLTMGPALCASLRKALPSAFFDVHLMVQDPALFVAPFRDAGADLLTFHVEAVTPPDAVDALAGTIRTAGMLAGLAFNPDTPAERVLTHLATIDLVLVMSVFPGFAGQKFIPEVLVKAAAIQPHLAAHQRLEIDGGVSPETAPACRAAGCDVLVAASAIFGAADQMGAIAALRGGDSRHAPSPVRNGTSPGSGRSPAR